ncbi:MAG: DUF4388 domain-containing protein [bacterium]|nr:DUF4388 domain-containing protein [bacterium]
MKRPLSGSLDNLPPVTLLRLIGATSPTGSLTLWTPEGELRLDIVDGEVPVMPVEELKQAGQVLGAERGRFRFEPSSGDFHEGDSVALLAFIEAACTARTRTDSAPSSDLDIDLLLDLTTIESATPQTTNIHVLPSAPLENPLGDLLSDLEETAPNELLLSQLGAVVADPRMWRGRLEQEWRRRGWQLQVFSGPTVAEVEELDCLLIHHQLSITRVGHEDDWLTLIRAARRQNPPVPVIWVGRLGDGRWVHELLDAGCSFLMPAPQGDTGETLNRFVEDLTTVVDSQLGYRQLIAGSNQSEGVGELIEALLREADPGQVISSLLLVAARYFENGALLTVEDTAIRCRAGFGYPLEAGTRALPRGVGLLERVVRSHEPVLEMDPDAAGTVRLARLLGVECLPRASAVIPLVAGAQVAAVLIGDNAGDSLTDVSELVLLSRRLGGAVLDN